MVEIIGGQRAAADTIYHDASSARLVVAAGAGTIELTLSGTPIQSQFSFDALSFTLSGTSPAPSPDYVSATFYNQNWILQRDLIESQTSQTHSVSVTIGNANSQVWDSRVEFLTAEVGANLFHVVSNTAQSGLSVLTENTNGTYQSVFEFTDTQETYSTGITSLSQINFGSDVVIIAASQTEHGLSSFKLHPDGHLSHCENIGAAQGIGISGITAAIPIQVQGKSYLLVGASGTGNISVFKISADGTMDLKSQVSDTLLSRFGQIDALEAITVNGQVLIAAGGGTGTDAGLTLFTLLPDGKLVLRESIADTVALGLDKINALAFAHKAGTLSLFAHSAVEPGLTRLIIDTSQDGITVAGTAQNDSLVGTAKNDILSDGAGVDQLRGGQGADIFVMEADGAKDTILDFNIGVDKVDLSAWHLLYSTGQLDIQSMAYGAKIFYGTEELVIQTSNAKALTAQDFFEVDMLGLHQTLPSPPRPDTDNGVTIIGTDGPNNIYGGIGNDILIGGNDDDLIQGLSGNDWLEGLGGNDEIRGGDGDDMIMGGNGRDIIFGHGGNDTIYGNSGADEIYGGDGDDYISSGFSIDIVYGGDGDDYIIGRTGQDTLYGEDGNDRLLGSAGKDQIWGGNGDDILQGGSAVDILHGGAGDDIIYGNYGMDLLYGDSGNDTIYGGSAVDTIYGGDDDDTLYGMEGKDVLFGELGNDVLKGGSGNDTLFGGAGNDSLFGNEGQDRLTGGTGNDMLFGGAASDEFVFDLGDGQDIIRDFLVGEDVLILSPDLMDQFISTEVTRSGGYYDVMCTFENGQSILFDDITNPNLLIDNYFNVL
jgi:Ca2+-binding RTX toxin-like protein